MKSIKKGKKLYIIAAISVVALIAILVAVKVIMINKGSTDSDKVETYDVESVKKVFMDGVVTPIDKEYIYYDSLQGEIDEVKVEDGQEVKKGDVLFVYRNEQISEQIDTIEISNKKLKKAKEEAEKAAAKAKEEAEKLQNSGALAEGNVPTVQDINSGTDLSYDDEIAYNQEQINKLKEKKYKSVAAPCDGKVTIGQVKTASNEPYMTIQSTGYYIEAAISEKDYEKVNTDAKVDITVLSSGNNITGTVYFKDTDPTSEVQASSASSMFGGSSQGTTQLSNYTVKISPDDAANLINGYHVQCVLKLSNEEIKIPASSVLSSDDEKYIFTIVNNKLEKVVVETGDESDEEIVIKSGLEGGEKIVKSPTSDMKEGDDIGE